MKAAIEQLLKLAVEEAGDPARERMFQMCSTLCIHRGVRPDEEEGLSAEWKASPPGMAGGPVRLLYSRGVDNEAGKPCENPGKELMDSRQPELYLPVDCSECGPCRARTRVHQEILTAAKR